MLFHPGDRVFNRERQQYGTVVDMSPDGVLVRVADSTTTWFASHTILVESASHNARLAYLERVERWFAAFIAHPQRQYRSDQDRREGWWKLHDEAQAIWRSKP